MSNDCFPYRQILRRELVENIKTHQGPQYISCEY